MDDFRVFSDKIGTPDEGVTCCAGPFCFAKRRGYPEFVLVNNFSGAQNRCRECGLLMHDFFCSDESKANSLNFCCRLCYHKNVPKGKLFVLHFFVMFYIFSFM